MNKRLIARTVWCAYQSSALGILTAMLAWAAFNRGSVLAALLIVPTIAATVTSLETLARPIREEFNRHE